MAPSKSVLGCLKTGARVDRFGALSFLAASLPENSRDAQDAAFIFFMFIQVNSRAAPLTDALIYGHPLGLAFYLCEKTCFARIGVLLRWLSYFPSRLTSVITAPSILLSVV
jgi:hypothetical protein